MKTKHNWTGNGPQIQTETLSDGSKVFNVVFTEAETIFCVDESHAMQCIQDLNEAAEKAV